MCDEECEAPCSIHPVTGRTLRQNLEDVEVQLADQDVVYAIDPPLKPTGGILVIKGNLAPDGAVLKSSGVTIRQHRGPARVFEKEETALQAILEGQIAKGDVLVIRYEGPQGGPGMREMLAVTSAIAGAGIIADVALITDGRFSGGSHGIVVGHMAPEAQAGGPIAAIQEGDTITIDLEAKTIDVDLSDAELASRLAALPDRPIPYRTAAAAATMRMTRTMMLEVLRQDYIRTAWSKGLKERAVVIRHAVRNALIPVVTLIGLQLPILVGGAVIMENIFNLPGLGRLLLTALNDRDYPMVSGINLFFATGVVGINLLIDLIYAVVDPRVRYD